MGWVSADHAVKADIRMYDRLFTTENLSTIDDELTNHLNPNSLEINKGVLLEPSLAEAKPGDFFQFERQGYFIVDKESTEGNLIFNRTVTLRDNWQK